MTDVGLPIGNLGAIAQLEALEALRLGFAPVAYACPTKLPSHYMLIGLNNDLKSVLIPNVLYRRNSTGFRKSEKKTHGVLGNIYDLSLLTNLTKPIAKNGNCLLDILLMLCGDVIGEDIIGKRKLPTMLRHLNKVLEYSAEGKKDHARLMVQWPIFVEEFLEHPSILDAAVDDRSLWDVMEKYIEPDKLCLLRKLKKFEVNWKPDGVPFNFFLGKLVLVAECLPQGAPLPQSRSECFSALEVIDMCVACFAVLTRHTDHLVRIIFTETNWRKAKGADFMSNVSHISDYVMFLSERVIHPIFPERMTAGVSVAEIILRMFGLDFERLKAASNAWHEERMQERGLEWHKARKNVPDSWPSATDVIDVPEEVVLGALQIIPLDTVEALIIEGSRQRHCVRYHDIRCAKGIARVFSIRRGGRILSTLSIYRDDDIVIEQHRAFANEDPNDEAKAAVAWFEGCINDKENPPPFRFDANWPNLLIDQPDQDKRRESAAEIFETIREHTCKRIKRGGFPALLELCGVQP